MSNFLPDLANWALRGGAGSNNNNNNNNNTTSDNGDGDATTINTPATDNNNNNSMMSVEELRAQRLARMEELLQRQQEQQSQVQSQGTAEPMDIDNEPTMINNGITNATGSDATHFPSPSQQTNASVVVTSIGSSSTTTPILPHPTISSTSTSTSATTTMTSRSIKKAKSDTTSINTIQRKKEQLLLKCLQIQLVGSNICNSSTNINNKLSDSSSNSNVITLDTGYTDITITTIAEIIAIRLSMDIPTSNSASQQQQYVIPYLGSAYNRTMEEIRNWNQNNHTKSNTSTNTNTNTNTNQEIIDLLHEMKHQIVSYTTTCIVEPDVFPIMSYNISIQIANALLVSICNISTTTTSTSSSTIDQNDNYYYNITLGGATNSFFTKIMDELFTHTDTSNTNDTGTSTNICTETIHSILNYYCTLLLQSSSDSIFHTIQIPSLQQSMTTRNTGTSTTTTSTTIGSCTPTNIVTAFTTMCILHKNVGTTIIDYPYFLLPPQPSSSSSSTTTNAGTGSTATNSTNISNTSTSLLPPTAPTITGTPPPFIVNAANYNSNETSSSRTSAGGNGMNPLLQLLSGNLLSSQNNGNNTLQRLRQRWVPRSGTAIEMGTILGLCLHFGIPKPPISNNPGFTSTTTDVLRQSIHTIESITRSQRQQLVLHQNECYNFIMSLLKIKNVPTIKTRIMQWFTDVLLLNVNASALRPDLTKVSSMNLLCNVSILLLKLCQPFVNSNISIESGDKKNSNNASTSDKQHLIDPQFIYHPSQPHGGVFTVTGDNAVPRLGNITDNDMEYNVTSSISTNYQPKNNFIPFCFFFCAHALHLSIVPALRQNEHLVRRINYLHYELTNRSNGNNMDVLQNDRRFAYLIAQQRSEDVMIFQEEYIDMVLQFNNCTAKVIYDWMTTHENSKIIILNMPEEFVSDICDILLTIVTLKPKILAGHTYKSIFQLFVKLLSPEYATIIRNYNLRAQLGDVLHDVFLPRPASASNSRYHNRDVPTSISMDPNMGGQTYLLSDVSAQETLAPSLLLLYGEVEHTGYYDKMSHRAKIASLIQYLWESSEHRPAFRRITQNKDSFIKFANGIMNETNTLIATVMQKLPEIREAQEKMKNVVEWSQLSEDEKSQITSRLEDNERDVKSSLPLCNKTLQMFGYLNTDVDIRSLFLLPELCSRLVTMLLHVLTKLVGSKGLDLKVENPEQYDFRPKEMLRDLCAIFALFASSTIFQEECAKSGCDSNLLHSAVRTCRRLHLLIDESMDALATLPDNVELYKQKVSKDEEILKNAPDEFLDEIMSTYMYDPVLLPSGHYVDRSTITQHLLNDPIDPFNREPLTIDQVQPAIELKERMDQWLHEQKQLRE